MTTANSNKPTTDAMQGTNIVVKSGNPALGIVMALLVGLGAFFAGMQFERSKRADYTVRVEGIPQSIPVVGVPETIRIAGAVQGIPETVRFQGSIEGVPEAVTVKAAPIVDANRQTGHIVVTANGGVYYVYYYQYPGASWSERGWRATELVTPAR